MKYKYRYVEQAKQTLSNEQGTIHKDWGGRLPIALAYPNSYSLGMSSLAVHTVYRLFNDHPEIVCERVFWGRNSPPRADEPVISLESQRPLDEFAVLAFSVSYELDYINLVHMLDRAGIPPLAEDRDESWPLVIAGGPPVTSNPAPLAEIVDAFMIGELEAISSQLVSSLESACLADRPDGLAELARLPGMYVPAVSTQPVKRVWIKNLDESPAKTELFTSDTEFGDRALLEIGRGCRRGCRFCMAGFAYRPMRELSLSAILEISERLLQRRDKLGLVSAAVSDHSQIDQVASELRAMGAKIAISSMRVDPLSEPLVRALAESGTQTVTIAPEAGSERLRTIINKSQTEEQVLRAVELIAGYGFPQLKMYFMVGLPGECEEDIEAAARLALQARSKFPRHVSVSVSPFVPKAQTPFQRAAMAPVDVLKDRIRLLQNRLQPERIAVRADSPAWSAMEAVLARGDSRLGRVMVRMRKNNLREWRRALTAEGLSEDLFLREQDGSEIPPWAVVDSRVGSAFLDREQERARQQKLTPSCPVQGCDRCEACGSDLFSAQS